MCWCDQLRKLIAPVQPVEKLVWSPATSIHLQITLYICTLWWESASMQRWLIELWIKYLKFNLNLIVCKCKISRPEKIMEICIVNINVLDMWNSKVLLYNLTSDRKSNGKIMEIHCSKCGNPEAFPEPLHFIKNQLQTVRIILHKNGNIAYSKSEVWQWFSWNLLLKVVNFVHKWCFDDCSDGALKEMI